MDNLQSLMDLADDLQRLTRKLREVALNPALASDFVEVAKKVKHYWKITLFYVTHTLFILIRSLRRHSTWYAKQRPQQRQPPIPSEDSLLRRLVKGSNYWGKI